ncbi:glycosyltransferase [Singulisphaera sp. Ch08]|uniref:Glycosyltransferase n=1 Tax=Singulisphaera sp. Ch08 TaxID=3120278 RepID=A0AAU7CFN3_9BACT
MRRNLTLAYLTSSYARASDTFIRGEVAQLRALGHTVHTFSIRRPSPSEIIGEEVARERAATIDILASGLPSLAWAGLCETARSPRGFFSAFRLANQVSSMGLKGRSWPFAYLLEGAFLARKLRSLGVEHLHNHFGEGVAAVAMLAAHLAEIPFSLTIHGSAEFDIPTQLALDVKVHHASFVVAISEYTRSQVYRWSAADDWSKIHIIRCGVNADFIEAPPTPVADTPRFVSVGRFAEQKGQLVLVQAVGLLRDRGVPCELVLVGDGPMRRVIEKLIDRLDLSDRVRITGLMGPSEVRREILAARGLVQPSFAEGLPVVLMEALALRRPVISTYIAGIPELVHPGVNGWLVPPGSVKALAEAMQQALATDIVELDRMGHAGAALVAERHCASTEASKLAQLITS